MMPDEIAIGWREVVLGVVALLALYVAVIVIRLRRLRTPQPAAGADVAAAPETTAAPALPEAPIELDFPWNEPPDPQPAEKPQETQDAAVAALAQRLQANESELRQLRDDVAAMRDELAALRDETGQRIERVQASHHVAPIYGDAMQMAVAGYDAAAIAERCGVARAEAELVVALIRNRDNNGTMRER